MRPVNDLNTTSVLPALLSMGSFAFVGAITPGPVNVLALRHGSNSSRQSAVWYVLGASLSYVAVVACMGLGSARLLQFIPQLAPIAQWLCAAYLLWLAWRLATAPLQPTGPQAPHTTTHAHQAFAQGLAVQSLNPKAWLFALSAVGVFALPQGGDMHSHLALLCTVSLLACMLGVGCWALLGRTLVHWLRTPQRQRTLHRALALLLAASIWAMLA